jgi:hypothetical protein
MANILTNVGKALIVSVLAGTGTSPKWVAWGTGYNGSSYPTAAVTDTALVAESAEARVSGTQSVTTTSVTNDTYNVQATMTTASAQSIGEVGLLDISTHGSGNLAVHADFTAIALAINDAISFTITIQQS